MVARLRAAGVPVGPIGGDGGDGGETSDASLEAGANRQSTSGRPMSGRGGRNGFGEAGTPFFSGFYSKDSLEYLNLLTSKRA